MILRERPWANLEALNGINRLSSFVAVMKLIFQRRPKGFVLLFPLFVWGLSSSVALLSSVALSGSAVFSAGSPVDQEANTPLADVDIQLRI